MKRMLSLLLVFILTLCLIPLVGSAEAGSGAKDSLIPIRNININGYRAPIAGSTPADSYWLSVDKNEHYFIVYQYWFDNTLNQDMTVESTQFDPTHLYSIGCVVSARDGYEIADDCVYRMNGSSRFVDASQTKPHGYLEGLWFVQSVATACAEENVTPKVTLSETSFTYDGTPKKPEVTVRVGNTLLQKNRDYSVTYEDNLNAGTAKAIVTLKGTRSGSAVKTFRIRKAAQEIRARAKTATVKFRDLQQQARIVSGAVTVTGAKGSLSWAKDSGSKYLTVDKKTGDITVRKNTPKGTYKIKVTVTAKATQNYLRATAEVTVKIRVK